MNRTSLMTLALATVVLAACGRGDSSDSTGPEPVKQTGKITLVNGSNTALVAVSIPSCEDPDWGANRLNGSEAIQPGARRSWTVDTGCYDLKASNGAKAAYWYDIQVSAAGEAQVTVPAALNASVVAADIFGSDLRVR